MFRGDNPNNDDPDIPGGEGPSWEEAMEGTRAEDLYWLTDVPYYIGDSQIDRIYKSIIDPSVEQKSITLDITDETAKQLQGNLNLEIGGELSPGDALGILMNSLIKPKLHVGGSGEGGISKEHREGFGKTIKLESVQTPQKKLRQLTAYYLLNLGERVFLVDDPISEEWRAESTIQDVPRELVFLNLPGVEEDKYKTRMVPLTAEFQNGDIFTIYEELESPPDRPDTYPVIEDCEDGEEYKTKSKDFAKWFISNFNSRQAADVVSELAHENGRIEWINYLVPISGDGESIELILRPSGTYPNGKFTRDFIQDGYQHGWRVVGMVRSGPKVEVLSVFGK